MYYKEVRQNKSHNSAVIDDVIDILFNLLTNKQYNNIKVFNLHRYRYHYI